jgi:hypothetical protein
MTADMQMTTNENNGATKSVDITIAAPNLYHIGGWLTAAPEDRTAWWQMMTQGPSDELLLKNWNWVRRMDVGIFSLAFTIGVWTGETPRCLAIGTAGLAAIFVWQWSEVNWLLLHQDRWLKEWSGKIPLVDLASINLLPEQPTKND